MKGLVSTIDDRPQYGAQEAKKSRRKGKGGHPLIKNGNKGSDPFTCVRLELAGGVYRVTSFGAIGDGSALTHFVC